MSCSREETIQVSSTRYIGRGGVLSRVPGRKQELTWNSRIGRGRYRTCRYTADRRKTRTRRSSDRTSSVNQVRVCQVTLYYDVPFSRDLVYFVYNFDTDSPSRSRLKLMVFKLRFELE